jgi:hypothetical protein
MVLNQLKEKKTVQMHKQPKQQSHRFLVFFALEPDAYEKMVREGISELRYAKTEKYTRSVMESRQMISNPPTREKIC